MGHTFRQYHNLGGCINPTTNHQRQHVFHPAQVPLGVKSQATFYIINNGYDNLELKFRLPADESHLPMQIDFPEVRYAISLIVLCW